MGLSIQSVGIGSIIITDLYLRKKVQKSTAINEIRSTFQNIEHYTILQIDGVLNFLTQQGIIYEDDEHYFHLSESWYEKININCDNPTLTIK